MEDVSTNEKRIRKITQLYYSRPDVQKAIFEFSTNREISPRYFEGFGKRPDSFQYIGEVFSLVKKGATSFHSSEELWENPLDIKTGMSEKEANEIRIGWDLLIDIDCKYFDYAKIAALAVIESLRQNKVKNIGIKFSGSKGWHILVPWRAFPKEINGEETKNMFPELPRKILGYLRNYSGKIMNEFLPEDFESQFKNVKIKRGIKCKKCDEVAENYSLVEFYCRTCKSGETRKIFENENKKIKCPNCKRDFEEISRKQVYHCNNCNLTSDKISSKEEKGNFSEVIETDLFELMGLDLVLVSPRHLFRTPYSLHEKTSLASVVVDEKNINNFDFKDANPLDVKVKKFMPEVKEGEANFLVMQALDWARENNFGEEKNLSTSGKYAEFKAVKLENLTDEDFPPTIKKILLGMQDGKKRAVFALINFFRSIGLEKDVLEKKMYEWNEKNETPLQKGYIKSQLNWSYRKKPILPPNFSGDFYKGLGVNPTPEEMRFKNPVTYTIRKNLSKKKGKKSSPKN